MGEIMEELRGHIWKATDQVYSRIKDNYNGEYQNGLEQVNDDAVKVAFTFCDIDGDGHGTKEELFNAIKKTESDIRFKTAWSDFAAIQAQMNLNLYDKNHNYFLDSNEIVGMMSQAEEFSKLMGIHFTNKERFDLGKIHSETETDGRPESRSWMEQINFILGHYSYLIQKL